jgi:hypothetical protein
MRSGGSNMSDYSNFISDFPNRLSQVLDLFEGPARVEGREVTLLLAVAAAGLTIPYERLKEPSSGISTEKCEKCKQAIRRGKFTHPSGDYERHHKAVETLKKLMEEDFVSSDLGKNAHRRSWRFKTLPRSEVVGPDRDSWFKKLERLDPAIKTSTVLKDIRNALAHGNIATTGTMRNNDGVKIIGKIGFMGCKNSKCDDFNCYSISPEDFRFFLKRWFRFLRGLHLPTEPVGDYLEYAL